MVMMKTVDNVLFLHKGETIDDLKMIDRCRANIIIDSNGLVLKNRYGYAIPEVELKLKKLLRKLGRPVMRLLAKE